MKTAESENLKSMLHVSRLRRILTAPVIILLLLILSTNASLAHCDTMDGPVIKDANIAISENNINYVLKWVQPQYESEIKDAFTLAMKVRNLNPDARIVAERYFFETLVRLHRSGEGVPFTGVKPSGTPVDEKIAAADKSIESGTLSPLKGLVAGEILPELEKRFLKVMSLKGFDVNDVKAGREYVEAYIQFFKFAEGEDEGHIHREAHN